MWARLGPARSGSSPAISCGVLGYEWGSGSNSTYNGIDEGTFKHVTMQAATIGIERTHSWSGCSPFLQLGVGVGRMTTEVSPEVSPWGDLLSSPADTTSVNGPAISAALGLRITPRPGPVGLVLGLRSSNVFTSQGDAHTLAASIGLTVHPQ